MKNKSNNLIRFCSDDAKYKEEIKKTINENLKENGYSPFQDGQDTLKRKMVENKMERFKVKETICKEIVNVINDGLGELKAEERKKLLMILDSVMCKWTKYEFEYWEAYADEDAEWDDYGCMNLVIEDFCKVWYDSIASELGLESYDEKKDREYRERMAARPEVVEVKKEDCDDGLPFYLH